MRFIQRALILVAALAATGTAWAQEASTPPEVSPTPVAAQPAEPAPDAQAAPVVPNPEAAPVAPNTEVIPVPAPEVAPLPQSAAPEAMTAPAQQEQKVAPSAPHKNTHTRKPAELKPAEPAHDQPDQKASSATAATAAAAPSDPGQAPPSSPASDATAVDSAVPPVPVGEQQPVVAPAVETQPASSHASLWLLLGGLLLGAGGIVSMLIRRGRDDSISIVDHGVPTISSRPPIVAPHPSRTSGSLS